MKKPKDKRKRTLHHCLDRQEEAYRDSKIETLIDFDEEYVSSAESPTIKKET